MDKHNTTAWDISRAFEQATTAVCDTVEYISAEDVESINRIIGGNVFGELNEILRRLSAIECATISAHKAENESII